MAREKQGSLREDAKQVVIEKQGGWDGYFHYLASDIPGLLSNRGEPSCPAIPLSSSWLQVKDSRKANKVEITFPANLGTFSSQMNTLLDHHKTNRLPRTFEIQARGSKSEQRDALERCSRPTMTETASVQHEHTQIASSCLLVFIACDRDNVSRVGCTRPAVKYGFDNFEFARPIEWKHPEHIIVFICHLLQS
jgi:hypothetical protein